MDRKANDGKGPWSQYGNRPPKAKPMKFEPTQVEQAHMPIKFMVERFLAAGEQYKAWKDEMWDLVWSKDENNG